MQWEHFDVIEQIKITRLFTLYKMHFNENYNFAGEMHDFWECMYILDGSMTVSADDRVHRLSYGDFILFKPYELHKFSVDSQSGATVITFSFNFEGEFCKSIEGGAYHFDAFQRDMLENFLDYLELIAQKSLGNEYQEYYWNILPYFKTDANFLQTVALFLSRILLSLSCGARTLTKTKTYETELFRRALQIMHENIDTNLSVDELAKAINISTSSLKRLFDRYAGMSVHKYFLSLKIKTATLFLKSGMSVNEVSDSLGFNNSGYFSFVYKRETGVNPSQI